MAQWDGQRLESTLEPRARHNGLRIPHLPQLQLRLQLRLESDPWPRNSIYYTRQSDLWKQNKKWTQELMKIMCFIWDKGGFGEEASKDKCSRWYLMSVLTEYRLKLSRSHHASVNTQIIRVISTNNATL